MERFTRVLILNNLTTARNLICETHCMRAINAKEDQPHERNHTNDCFQLTLMLEGYK